MTSRATPTVFGAELRRWRQTRRYSQEQLAIEAEVSQRHLSYLENGRTRPSVEMVQHLAATLEVPLRARNGLLVSAGFAPSFTEEPFDGERMKHVRTLLETLVEAHDPFPAFVVNRRWDLVLANTAALRLMNSILDPTHGIELSGNMLRLFLHPDGLRAHVVNWPQAAAMMVRRLRSDCSHAPGDEELRHLLDEVLDYEGVAGLASESTSSDLLIEIQVRTPGGSILRFFTTITTLSDATDITVAELHLETLLPADPATTAWLSNG